MATERQIEANRRNAALSSGPKTEEGKARSRANAIKHGLAGESAELEETKSPEFVERRAQWGAEYKPVGQAADWAMDRAVAASLRIERCETAFDLVTVGSRERARLAWDMDREVEAATIFGRLKRDPGLASRQLMTSLSGVGLLIEAWTGLSATLQGGKDWSEPEESMAMDLLGISVELRTGRTMIDSPDEAERIAIRKAIVIDEIDRLEAVRDEVMGPLDAMDRRMAMGGAVAMLSKPAKLVLRYERDAWRRYREAMARLQDQGSSSPVVIATPSRVMAPRPVVATRPLVRDRVVDERSKAVEEERRALRAEAKRITSVVTDDLVAMGFDDEDAWLDELERRIEARSATERTQFEGAMAGSGQAEAPSR